MGELGRADVTSWMGIKMKHVLCLWCSTSSCTMDGLDINIAANDLL